MIPPTLAAFPELGLTLWISGSGELVTNFADPLETMRLKLAMRSRLLVMNAMAKMGQRLMSSSSLLIHSSSGIPI
jgi:hypothetical protein